MSKWVVVVPGIMGSSLLLDGEQIWPPGLWDFVGGYDEIGKLMDDRAEVGSIIYKVAIRSIYKTLLDDVRACGYSDSDQSRLMVQFPYDWRRSNSDAAGLLAARLDELADDLLPDEITFVAHSMGGLVVRRLLESGEFSERRWFGRIRRLITLGTPHGGAPLAISRLRGNERYLGVSGPDIVRLASDERYPSSYELAGPPNSAFTLDLPGRGDLPRRRDRFSDEYVHFLKLNSTNVEAGNDFWSHLSLERRPPAIDYLFVAGAAHETTTACASDGVTFTRTTTKSGGDGTVPVASALAQDIPHLYSSKEHVRIFEDRGVREALYVFLDAPVGVRPQSAGGEQPVGEAGAVGLSVDKPDYEVDEPIEIVVSYATPVDQPVEGLWLDRCEEGGSTERVEDVTVSLDAPGVSSLSITVRPHLVPGVYQLRSERPTDDPEPTIFRVLG